MVSLLLAVLAWVWTASAQEASETKPAEAAQAHGRLVLVLPFANQSGDKDLGWISLAFPDVLNRRLGSTGFLTISRGDRLYAYDHLGLPTDLQPTRATAIRIAQMLDADYVIFGHFGTVGEGSSKQLSAQALILDVSGLRLSGPIEQRGDPEHLLQTANSLAWKVALHLDPTLGVDEQTFIAADKNLHTEAFRDYIQGLATLDSKESIADLRSAVKLAPEFAPAWLALGRAYFADEDYDEAATTLGHLPADDPNALEADFYRGLAFFYTGNYREAEDAFAFVSTRLPLPEVVNNQGVAATRRGKDGGALFEQAIASDPRDPDYHFNLAVALAHRNDTAGAVKELNEVLKLRPEDTEAQSFANQLQNPAAAGTSAAPDPDPGHAIADTQGPLTRIKRGYSEAGFRQAAFELEQLHYVSLPCHRRSALPS
jgi:tetratricopeptide (TPR) repeat protein